MTSAPNWDEAIVEGSLDWSFLSRDDLAEIADLRAAIEYLDDPAQHRTLEDLESDFDRPYAYPHRHAVVGRDRGGTVVAYAWNHVTDPNDRLPHAWMELGVHPAWRHHKIGLRLVGWSIERARAWYRHIAESRPGIGPLWVGMAVDEQLRTADDLADDGQLHPERWFFDAHKSLEEARIPQPQVPGSLVLAPFSLEYSEAVRQAHNEAFSTRHGAHDVDVAAWNMSVTRADFRSEWSWIVLADDGPEPLVVAYALNSEIVDEESGVRQGWTERIGVRPRYRDRGLGHALLYASLGSFSEAGCQLAGIGVDTDDAVKAAELFAGIGYQLDDRMVLYGATFWD